MKRFLKSTTALVLTISLAAPGPVLSQEIPFDITGMTQEEIVAQLIERGIVTGENALEMANRLAEEALEDAEGDGTEAPAEEGAEATDEAQPEAEEEVEAPTDVGEELPGVTETEPAADATAEEIVNAEAEVTPETETEAEADVEAETEAEAEAATEAEADSETEEAADTSEADTEVEAEAETETGDTGTEVEAEADTETETASDTDTEAETEGEADAETNTEAEPEVVTPDSDPEPVDSETQAATEAEVAAESQESLAASGEGEAEAEVVEETVTEETARSSSEEFETDVTGEARAEDDDDDDDGLSNAQKAALLGLGTLALSQILKPNEEVVANTGDRVVVERDGQYRVIKNDDALLRRPGSDVTTYRYQDGSTRTVVVREDGVQVETVRARDGRVLRRTRILNDGTEVVLFDDTQEVEQVEVNELPQTTDRRTVDVRSVQADELAAALAAAQATGVDRRFSLSQVRNIDAVRKLVPEINVDTINFATNSAVIQPDEARELSQLGNAISLMIENNPREVFLIEGHTDAVGAAQYNLALSDRRAESVALALTEYFDVPPENLVVQGYGETDLLRPTADAERANRRAAVRRITPLLQAR